MNNSIPQIAQIDAEKNNYKIISGNQRDLREIKKTKNGVPQITQIDAEKNNYKIISGNQRDKREINKQKIVSRR